MKTFLSLLFAVVLTLLLAQGAFAGCLDLKSIQKRLQQAEHAAKVSIEKWKSLKSAGSWAESIGSYVANVTMARAKCFRDRKALREIPSLDAPFTLDLEALPVWLIQGHYGITFNPRAIKKRGEAR